MTDKVAEMIRPEIPVEHDAVGTLLALASCRAWTCPGFLRLESGLGQKRKQAFLSLERATRC
jgi:hypothetical protein